MTSETSFQVRDDETDSSGNAARVTLETSDEFGRTQAGRRHLIQEQLAFELLSHSGVEERYQRGKTPHTIFTWWARRPFAAMRGVLAATLAESPRHATALVAFRKNSERSLELGEPDTSARVLDMFAGGGTIPLEAASMGADAYALDNNELAHFIQLALLKFSQMDSRLPDLVTQHGRDLLEALTKETAKFFPLRERKVAPVAYFWSRSVRCPECNSELSLQKRPWLSKKKGKWVHIERRPDASTQTFTISLVRGVEETRSESAWSGAVIQCPFCSHVIERSEIDVVLGDCGFDELTSICLSNGRGKDYVLAGLEAVPSTRWLEEQIAADLDQLKHSMPQLELPCWSGIVNPSLYGIHSAPDLFALRQLAVLIRLCRLLREKYEQLVRLLGDEHALAVTVFLSGLIDQLVDWNSRLCMWIPQNEQVGRALSGPGIPMMWDFVETDPLQKGPANLWDKLDRIVAGLRSIPEMRREPNVIHGDARRLPFEANFFDAVVTDPPYFDNVFYSVLADCIYVWKRLIFRDLLPNVFASEKTDEESELSASKHRHGSSNAAEEFYASGMTAAFKEARRVLREDGVLVLIFAHSSIGGWTSIVDAFRSSEFPLQAAWPLQMERKHRPRGMRSEAVNVSFALVASKGELVEDVEWRVLSESVEEGLAERRAKCEQLGLSGGDLGHAIFGSLVQRFALSKSIKDGDRTVSTREALTWLASRVEQEIPNFKIARR